MIFTKRAKKPKFNQLATTRKGKRGEKIAIDYFKVVGYLVLTPENTRTPHEFDLMLIDSKIQAIYCADVKVSAERTLYSDNGLDLADFMKYLEYAKRCPFLIVWIDENRRSMYSIALNAENVSKAKYEGDKVYFDLRYTKVLKTLTHAELDSL